MSSLIFHYPLPLKEEISGSQVHLQQTLRAFEDLGLEVERVTGYARERAQRFEQIRRDVAAGRRFDFVYAWSPTVPTLLAKRNFLHPWLDWQFLRWCNAQRIPVGLFYGDVHWRFPHFRRAASFGRRTAAVPLYLYDWLIYKGLVDHLFVPTLRMASVLPTRWPADRMSALYPGCNPVDLPLAGSEPLPDKLTMFYVGGIVPPLYDLSPMVGGVNEADGVSLTICCRAAEWAQAASFYGELNSAKVQIVHAHGTDLAQYYAAADVFGLFWRAYPYWSITLPVKVFESIGYGVPLITTSGTEAARVVAEEGAGWTPTTADDFTALLERLKARPDEVTEARRHVRDIRVRHTWQRRAQQIADTLTKQRAR